jgi:Spy/CpxP family protein refolding chaperone
MKEIRRTVLRDQVGLADKKLSQVEAALDRHGAEREKLQQRVHSHRKALRDLVEKDSSDQKSYEKAIADLRAAQSELHQLRNKQVDELSRILTPKEQAKVLLHVGEMHRKLQRALRSYEKRGGGKR